MCVYLCTHMWKLGYDVWYLLQLLLISLFERSFLTEPAACLLTGLASKQTHSDIVSASPAWGLETCATLHLDLNEGAGYKHSVAHAFMVSTLAIS